MTMIPRRLTLSVLVTVFVLTFSLPPKVATAHGTYGQIKAVRGWMIQAFYDDGEAMSYTETRVFSGKDTAPAQTGRTDRNGRFLFYPDKPGIWKVVVEDEMGHAVILEKDIPSIETAGVTISGGDSGALPVRQGKASGVLAGVGIISLVFSLYFWRSARKALKQKGREEINL